MHDTEFQDKLLNRLNTLISVMLEVASDGNEVSVAEKIQRLLKLGLTPAEVGEILRKPTNYVTAVMHKNKKKVKRKDTTNG